jgi:hypothetical protein
VTATRRRAAAPALVAAVAACAVVSVATLALRWGHEDDEFDRAGSRGFTRQALEHAGLRRVEVEGAVEATRYRPRTFAPDDPPLEVFRTIARTEGGTVELLVHPGSGRAVYLRDVAADGGPLLDDAEYRRLRDFEVTGEADEADRRRTWGSVGAGLVSLTAIGTAFLARREMMAA